jgi:spermidine/putrescine transport system substrate-binding protein
MFRTKEIYAAMAWEKVAWTLNKENPNIDYVAPSSGAQAWIDTFTLPSKSENLDGAYKWINFCLRPENASVISNKVKYNTSAVGTAKYLDPVVAGNFARCFTPEVMKKMKWYPAVPPGLEQMEGKTLDRVRASN